MRAFIAGVVLDVGASVPRPGATGRRAEPFFWVKLYQRDSTERPGETADIWSPKPLDVKVGEDVVIEASLQAEGDRLRIRGARVASGDDLRRAGGG